MAAMTFFATAGFAVNVIASIPSPSSGSLELGPLRLNAYGLMIALGAIAATWLMGRRLESRGWGTRDDASSIAIWAVPAGVVGARMYHVITDWERFNGRFVDVFKIWKGGLGIWGGIALGVAVGLYVARRRGLSVSNTLTAVAPALPLAQAIGRIGNWFNQELFGRATTLPWGLEIDARKIPDGYEVGTLFHPTFLYESLGLLVLMVILLQIDRRAGLREGRLFLVYAAGYSVLRFFVEGLRIDPARSASGLRLNQWVSLVVFSAAVVMLFALRRRDTTDDTAARQD
ncbi:MAG: prolipoprotein diacylglyceryl transferase [Actinobacteria bacterium]|nr:prolipoprotein diacylglyceryl transferase [Actinomycetota bacterium]